MKRRDFFKSLSAGTAALLVAPALLPKHTEEKLYSTNIQRKDYTPEMWNTAEIHKSEYLHMDGMWKELVERYGDVPLGEFHSFMI